jgi:hypothetical protein
VHGTPLVSMSQSIERPASPPAPSHGEPAALLQVAYVSSATAPWSKDELLTALAQFRARNEARGITGMLLHFGGNFMQVIEGPTAVVEALVEKIARDPRHHGYMELMRRPLRQREFDGWSMGFRNLGNEDLSELPGWSDFLGPHRQAEVDEATPTRARRLLQSFRGNVLR